MTKPKHTVFCNDCGRSKLLFETEKKADTFIKFNADTISNENGKKPIRSYYCIACGGWHVTSQKLRDDVKATFSDKMISLYKRDKENLLKMKYGSKLGKFVYLGLFLTDESRDRLIKSLPKGVNIKALQLTHCTMLHKSQLWKDNAERCIQIYMSDINCNSIEHTIKIVGYGRNEKAMAFKCKVMNVPCMNDQAHITICTYDNGKPIDSNTITEWTEIEPINVKAIWKKI